MNTKNKAISIFLFVASLAGLFFFWGVLTEALLVPYDTTLSEARPPLDSPDRTINDYFELSPGSELPAIILLTISLLIVVLRIKRQGTSKMYQIFEHSAVSNFLYIGLIVTLFFIYSWIAPIQTEATYSPFGIIVNLAGIISLFVFQYRSSTYIL